MGSTGSPCRVGTDASTYASSEAAQVRHYTVTRHVHTIPHTFSYGSHHTSRTHVKSLNGVYANITCCCNA